MVNVRIDESLKERCPEAALGLLQCKVEVYADPEEFLALLNGKLFGTDRDINVLLQKLAELAAEQGAEFVTLFSGEGVSEEDANAACELFSQCCSDAEVSALPGGQPVYYYIISIE